MRLVVVGEPGGEAGDDGVRVRPVVEARAIALERLHERLADAVGFEAADRGEAEYEAQGVGEVYGVVAV